jgi:RNA polymerase sigma factor (sigma-70 family)
MEIGSNLTPRAQQDYKLVLDALNNGNQKAYAQLMDRYRDTIFYMMLKMANNRDDADDLTIEAFGKAFKRLEYYSPLYSFSTWLFKIATNNAIDFIRKRKLMLLNSIDQNFENADGDEYQIDIKWEGLTPEEKLMKKQQIKELRGFVDKLKPRYKLLIELRYYDELSYEEIAVRTQIPLGTIKAQLFRAKDLLYEIMKRANYKA